MQPWTRRRCYLVRGRLRVPFEGYRLARRASISEVEARDETRRRTGRISEASEYWFNALGARMQGTLFTYKRLAKLYDRVHSSLLKQVDSIKDDKWQCGMYYPTRWDSELLSRVVE